MYTSTKLLSPKGQPRLIQNITQEYQLLFDLGPEELSTNFTRIAINHAFPCEFKKYFKLSAFLAKLQL